MLDRSCTTDTSYIRARRMCVMTSSKGDKNTASISAEARRKKRSHADVTAAFLNMNVPQSIRKKDVAKLQCLFKTKLRSSKGILQLLLIGSTEQILSPWLQKELNCSVKTALDLTEVLTRTGSYLWCFTCSVVMNEHHNYM